jgi:Xaa-Pro aminopeptidase
MSEKSVMEKIKRKMSLKKIDAFFISNRHNVRYLSGFTGSAGYILIMEGCDYLITDFRYREQAKNEAPGFLIYSSGGKLLDKLNKLTVRKKIKNFAFESGSVSYSLFKNMEKAFKGMNIIPLEGEIEKVRMVKSPSEINMIKKACSAADRAMRHVKGYLKPGVLETDLEAELFYYIKTVEGGDFSFPPIIISGERTSLPHGRPSLRKLRSGDMVMIDFGVRLGGYCSDLTRTFCVGRMSDEKKKLYETVLLNQSQCIEKLAPGEKAGSIFNFSRLNLVKEDFDLLHGLGHGVGLQVHELPSLSRGVNTRLKENMVFTIEPGVYIQGKFGVRIEDVAVMKKSGVELLSSAPKKRNEV